jgi:pilus assembly protein CpaB
MILRVVFFALMALGLTGFGTVAWLSTRPPVDPAAQAAAQAPAAPTKRTILVTARPVHAGNLLKPEDLIAKEVPIEGLDVGALADTPDTRLMVVGSMVRCGLAAGEMVRSEAVLKPGEHGFLAAVLGPSMRGLTIGVDSAAGSSGLIWPGDRVDVILTQSLGDALVPIGRRVAAETVLRNVRVIAIDQQLIQGAAPVAGETQSRTVTLEVSAEAAERLSVAMRLGRLSLSLRSAIDPDQGREQQTRPIWARDVSPALGNEGAPTTENVVRIFQGGGDAKEFRF